MRMKGSFSRRETGEQSGRKKKKKGVYCQAENFKYVILEKPPFSTVKVIQISLFDEGN